MQLLSQWLEKRPEFSLHSTQLTSAEELFKVSQSVSQSETQTVRVPVE